MDLIASLAADAATAPDTRRPGMAGAINEVLARLPSEAGSEETAPRLQRLLEEGRLDGLTDEEGLPSSVAATRALLGLGYPHALGVSPERLEALRAWERRGPPVPWGLLTGTLLVAAVVQLFFMSMGSGPRLFGLSVAALAGEAPPPRGLMDWVREEGTLTVGGGLLLANGFAWLAAITVGRRRKALPWVRRGFLGIAALGLLPGCVYLSLDLPGAGWGTFASAAGALVAWRTLKAP
jgi:hypothetical protein